MKVISIDWLSEDIEEAILTVVSGTQKFEVFSHPCRYKVGDCIEKPLETLDNKNIVRVDAQEPFIRQIGDTFEHEIVAKVESVKLHLVSVNEVKINLDIGLPGDISDGEFISFRTERLDA